MLFYLRIDSVTQLGNVAGDCFVVKVMINWRDSKSDSRQHLRSGFWPSVVREGVVPRTLLCVSYGLWTS